MNLKHPVNKHHYHDTTLGERASDYLAKLVGSWRFVIVQNILVVLWIVANSFLLVHPIYFQHNIKVGAYDPFPFLLLNIVFSWQASNAAPILQMTQNRQAQKDRDTLEHTFRDTEEILNNISENTEITKEQTKLMLEIMNHMGITIHEKTTDQQVDA